MTIVELQYQVIEVLVDLLQSRIRYKLEILSWIIELAAERETLEEIRLNKEKMIAKMLLIMGEL